MKVLFFVLAINLCQFVYAQNEESAIKKAIITFFEGMETNDTAKVRSTMDPACFLKSVMVAENGNTIIENEAVEHFFQLIIKFKDVKVKEELLSFDIKIDGVMATVWTPYKIYFNDNFGHCGVNSFTMIKQAGSWKILGVIDTRREQGCM